MLCLGGYALLDNLGARCEHAEDIHSLVTCSGQVDIQIWWCIVLMLVELLSVYFYMSFVCMSWISVRRIHVSLISCWLMYRRSFDCIAKRASGCILQGHWEARGLPVVDHWYRWEGQPDSSNHRQATSYWGSSQGPWRRAVVVARTKLTRLLPFNQSHTVWLLI